jgi:hypothetical protein
MPFAIDQEASRAAESHHRALTKHRFASDCVVVDALQIEPVSTSNSLLTGKLTGNFADSGALQRFWRPVGERIQ